MGGTAVLSMYTPAAKPTVSCATVYYCRIFGSWSLQLVAPSLKPNFRGEAVDRCRCGS